MPTREQYEKAIGLAQKLGRQDVVQNLIGQARGTIENEGGVLANLGAGFSNFLEGGKQLVGLGMDDDALREKRQLDEELANKTTGGGLLQMAGEAAPSFLIPGGTGAKLLTKALGRAPAAGRIGVGTAAGGAALEGAAAGAFTPTTSDESKLAAIGLSAGFGGGVPVLGKTLAAGGRGVGRAVERGLSALPTATGAAAAGRIAAREADAGLRASQVPLDPARYRAQDYQPLTRNAPGSTRAEFEPTTAGAYNSVPQLGAVEKAVRGADPGSWVERDAREAGKRWEHLDTSLRGQPDIDRALAHADTLTPPYEVIAPAKWHAELGTLARQLESLTGTPQYFNPVVKSAVDTLRAAVNRDDLTPAALHEMRKVLAKGLSGAPGLGEAGVRAATSEPHVLKLLDMIDDTMSRAAYAKQGDRWADWRQNYSATMREAEGSKAEEQLRRKFVDERGVPLTAGPEATPTLTLQLNRAAERMRNVKKGPQAGQNIFTPQAEQAVADVMRDLHAQGIVNRVQKAATLGDSGTASNIAQMGVMGLVGDLLLPLAPGLSTTAGVLVGARAKHNIDLAKRTLLTRIMQDPAQFRAFVDEAARRAQRIAQQQGVSSHPALRYGAAGAAIAPELQSETE